MLKLLSTVQTGDLRERNHSQSLTMSNHEGKVVKMSKTVRKTNANRPGVVLVTAVAVLIMITILLTAVVGYVSVSDVTRASDIIRGRTYDALFPLIVVAIIYFLLCTLITSIIKIPLTSYINKRIKYDD